MPESVTIVDTLTIAPLPLLAIRGASSATRKYGALTLSEYTLSNSSSVVLFVGPNGKIPGLLIRISTWPFPSSTALFDTSRALDASRRSDEINSALPPAARISATVLSPRSTLRPTTSTWMPSSASLLAAARPIPLVPPVMSAVGSSVVINNSPFWFRVGNYGLQDRIPNAADGHYILLQG